MKTSPLKTVILWLALFLLNECLCGLEFDGVYGHRSFFEILRDKDKGNGIISDQSVLSLSKNNALCLSIPGHVFSVSSLCQFFHLGMRPCLSMSHCVLYKALFGLLMSL